jgi:phage-related protein
MNYKKIAIENWLLGTNSKSILIDEDLKGYYYMAECTDVNFDNYYSFGLIDITFTAYPFKIGEAYEGNNLWDSFNFELDVLQDTKFTVNGTLSVSIYNPSVIDIEPEIIASSQFEITLDNKKYVVEVGTSKDYRFKLKKGANNLTLKGNGTIEFRFRKEVL